MRTSGIILVSLALAASVAVGKQAGFSADVTIKVANGHYDAKFYYTYNTYFEHCAMRFDYTSPTEMTELINFTASGNTRYKYCSSCESGYYVGVAPKLFPVAATDTTVVDTDADGCKHYVRSDPDDGVTEIWYKVDEDDDTEYTICKAVLAEGRTLIFTNYESKTFLPSSDKWSLSSECPGPVCKRIMDLVFVLDTSRSICTSSGKKRGPGGGGNCGLTDWKKVQDFAINIIDSFDIADDAAMVGVITFCGTSTVQTETGLTSSKTTAVSKIEAIADMCLGTCIGCGIESAITMFNEASETRKAMNPERMLVIMTDGQNNRPQGSSEYCKSYTPKCVSYNTAVCKTYGDCLEYECTQRNPDVCVKYEDTKGSTTACAEYECTQRNPDVCVKEACNEYECLEYELECASKGTGSAAYLSGAISKLRSGYALTGIQRDILTIAIGVGDDVDKDEFLPAASTLGGEPLYYAVDNFDGLSQVLEELVQTTCTNNQVGSIELCSANCNGFCGCEKKCYCPTCDAGDECTTYSCVDDGAETAGCLPKETQCTDDKCKEVTRDPAHKGCCIETEKVCPDQDACHVASCMSSVGCIQTPIECKPESSCFNFTECDPLNGCKYIPACEDRGICFTTKCVPNLDKFECTYEPVCKPRHPCEEASCDPATGECTYTDITCEPTNDCYYAYCEGGVCVEKFNTTRDNECASMADQQCTKGFCNTETGKCDVKDVRDISDNCGACDLDPKDCPSDECFTYMCDGDSDGNTYCKVVEEACVNGTDPCIIANCVGEDSDRTCEKKPVECTPIPCHDVVCVPDPYNNKEPFCNYTYKCKSDDACTFYQCNEDTDTCEPHTKCEEKICQTLVSCDDVFGEKDCKYEPLECVSTSKCLVGSCSDKTGQCVFSDNSSNCNGDDPCTRYWCDDYYGCMSEPITCDDENPCTIDTCVPKNGTVSDDELPYVCKNEPKCTTDKYCEKVSCSIVTGNCTYYTNNCEDYNGTLDSCHVVVCDEETRKCKSTLILSAVLDVCGDCIKTYGTDAMLNITAIQQDCIGGMTMPEFAAAIGGAAVAAIVIAAIIVAAIIAVSSAMGTRELIKRAKNSGEISATNNPLYEDNENEATNPLYEGDL